MILETALSIFSAAHAGLRIYQEGLKSVRDTVDTADKATKLFDWFSGTSVGSAADAKLQQASHRSGSKIIRLSDQVYADLNLREAINQDHDAARLSDPRFMREILDPVAKSIGANVFSSQISSTPRRLQERFSANPWSVLIDPRPANLVGSPPTSDHVPIMFMYDGQPFIGWQMRGALDQLFNCDFHVASSPSRPAVPSQPAPAPSTKQQGHQSELPLFALIKEQVLAAGLDSVCMDQNLINKTMKIWYKQRGFKIGDYKFGVKVLAIMSNFIADQPFKLIIPKHCIALLSDGVLICWREEFYTLRSIKLSFNDLIRCEFAVCKTLTEVCLEIRLPGKARPMVVPTAGGQVGQAIKFLQIIQRVMA